MAGKNRPGKKRPPHLTTAERFAAARVKLDRLVTEAKEVGRDEPADGFTEALENLVEWYGLREQKFTPNGKPWFAPTPDRIGPQDIELVRFLAVQSRLFPLADGAAELAYANGVPLPAAVRKLAERGSRLWQTPISELHAEASLTLGLVDDRTLLITDEQRMAAMELYVAQELAGSDAGDSRLPHRSLNVFFERPIPVDEIPDSRLDGVVDGLIGLYRSVRRTDETYQHHLAASVRRATTVRGIQYAPVADGGSLGLLMVGVQPFVNPTRDGRRWFAGEFIQIGTDEGSPADALVESVTRRIRVGYPSRKLVAGVEDVAERGDDVDGVRHYSVTSDVAPVYMIDGSRPVYDRGTGTGTGIRPGDHKIREHLRALPVKGQPGVYRLWPVREGEVRRDIPLRRPPAVGLLSDEGPPLPPLQQEYRKWGEGALIRFEPDGAGKGQRVVSADQLERTSERDQPTRELAVDREEAPQDRDQAQPEPHPERVESKQVPPDRAVPAEGRAGRRRARVSVSLDDDDGGRAGDAVETLRDGPPEREDPSTRVAPPGMANTLSSSVRGESASEREPLALDAISRLDAPDLGLERRARDERA